MRVTVFLPLSLFMISFSTLAITNEPSEKQLLEILFSNANLPINTQPQCASAFSQSGDILLGSYLAGHISNFSEPGENILKKECNLVNNQWNCSISFNHIVADKEAFSNYGVKFNLTEKNGLIKESIVCIGQ